MTTSPKPTPTRGITEEERAEWRTVCDRATPGPWAYESVGLQSNEWCIGVTYPLVEGEIVEQFDEGTHEYLEKPAVVDFLAESGNEASAYDIQLMAMARTVVPRLLAEVDRLRPLAEAGEMLHAIFGRLLDSWLKSENWAGEDICDPKGRGTWTLSLQLHGGITPTQRIIVVMKERDVALGKLRAIGELLAANGCSCECDHHPDEHEDDCERCLACRVGAALGEESTYAPRA